MDKNALEQLLSSYNWWMGLSTIAVAIGILGEYVAHFVFEDEARHNKREMAVSILFGAMVLGGVVGEYIFGKRMTQISEQLQQIADAEVAQANKDAAQARKDAEKVKRQSADTNERAAKAEKHAAEENVRAAKALESAEVARKNTEGFSLQIAQANERASNAEQHAAEAALELARIKSPRSIVNVEVLTAALKPFMGTEYTVIGCFQDQESTDLLINIDTVLANAGWTRVKPSPQNSFADIELNISKDFAVPITTRSGVYVGVQSTETVDALKTTPQPMLPMHIRAAMALKGGLASSISPADAKLATPLNVDHGNSASVFIIVGKKP